MIIPPKFRPTLPGILFLVLWSVASFVLLKGLSHTMLWQDEAHTAILAERILQYGYPKVWDGINLVTGMNGADFNGAYALTWDGWLPYYVTSGSFALLGRSVFAARLPFVLAAIATFPLLYLFVVHALSDRWLAFWSAVFLAVSMTFLLHSRQCRYYGLIPFAVLLVYLGLSYLPRWRGVILIAAGSVIVYHSNLLNFAMLALSFLLIPLFFKIDGARLKSFLTAMALVFAATFPMFLYTRVWEKTSGFQSEFRAALYAGQTAGNLIFLNKFYLPLALLGAAVVLGGRFLDRRQKNIVLFAGVLCAAFVVLIPFKFYTSIRYLLPLLPVASLVLAIFHLGVWRKWRITGIALFLVSFTTHAWDYLPMKAALETARFFGLSEELDRGYRGFDDEEGKMPYDEDFVPLYVPTFSDRFWKLEYRSLTHELFHPFQDSLGEVISFLKGHRRRGERVYLSVGQYPLLFHAPDILLAYTISAPLSFAVKTKVDSSQWDLNRIDWYVPRFYKQAKGPHLTEKNFLKLAEDRQWKIEKYVLNTPNLLWEGNWPSWMRFYRIKQREFPLLNQKPTVIYHVVRN